MSPFESKESKHKIVLFAATAKGLAVLKTMLEPGSTSPAAVVSFKEDHTEGGSYARIRDACAQGGILFHEWRQVKSDLPAFLASLEATEAIAVGWKYLINPADLGTLNLPLVVFHDSLLPKYRGFAPTATAILCGDEEIGMSVIFAGADIDDGDIILQRSTHIGSDAYIAEALDLQSELYSSATKELLHMLSSGKVSRTPQDEQAALYSIWRSPEDARIDWTKPALAIYRMIRAAGYPYPGAFTFIDRTKIHIERAELVQDLHFAVRDPGKIWRLQNGMPIVVCGTGMLKITHAIDAARQPVTFVHLRKRFS